MLKTDERLVQRLVGTLFAGETFGELALLHRQLRTATVVADLPSTILYLKTDAYDKVGIPIRFSISLMQREDKGVCVFFFKKRSIFARSLSLSRLWWKVFFFTQKK